MRIENWKEREVENTCDVCGSKNLVDYPVMGINCEDCNPIKL